MNLLPVADVNSKAVTESKSGKKSQESSDDSQVSEFTDVLSDALDQQGIPTEGQQDRSEPTTPQQIQVTLQASGQELPLAGNNLPQDNKAVSELDLIEGVDIVPTYGVFAFPTPVALETGSAGDNEGQTFGSHQVNQRASALLTPVQTAAQGLQGNLLTQTGSGENSFNGQSAPGGQLLSLPELQVGSADDNLDFSRIIEKGLSQLNREMNSSNHVLSPVSTTSASLESLKSSTETLQLQQHIDKPGWSQEFGNRLIWLSKEGVQSAQLRLTPANLGSIEIKITIQNDQANVSFVSQHGAVRDVIEASLPRLREMMQEAGVNLGQANVSSDSNTQQHNPGKMPGQFSQAGGLYQEDNEAIISSSTMLLEHGNMLSAVDYYA